MLLHSLFTLNTNPPFINEYLLLCYEKHFSRRRKKYKTNLIVSKKRLDRIYIEDTR
jgi:hypothetical protein